MRHLARFLLKVAGYCIIGAIVLSILSACGWMLFILL